MNKKVLLTLGILSPVAAFIVQMVMQFSIMFNPAMADNPEIMFEKLSGMFSVLMVPYSLMLIFTILYMAYMVRHILTNDAIEDSNKTVWIILLFVFQLIPAMVYMFMHVYKEPWKVMFDPDKRNMDGKTVFAAALVSVPAVFLMGFMLFMGRWMGSMGEMITGAVSEEEFLTNMMGFFAVEIVLFIIMFIVWVCFLVLVLRNQDFTGGQKAMWILLAMFFNMIAMAAYTGAYLMYPIEEEEEAAEVEEATFRIEA